MGLLHVFISNVFDIYPSQNFLDQFLTDNSLDISKVLSHPFLKLSLAYSFIWNHIYKTYPTKRDFINYINTVKIIPEACTAQYDKAFIEKTLNTFIHVKMGILKHLDTLNIFNTLQTYIVDLDNQKYIHDALMKKWLYRYSTIDEPKSQNLFLTFAAIYNKYTPINMYKYQINPVTNSYNETVLFGSDDDTYLNEHEKIQYTIYKDNHFMMKLIDNIGIYFDVSAFPVSILNLWLESIYDKDKFINIINCPIADVHDVTCTHVIQPSLMFMFPALFSKFICVSEKAYPTQKALSINKDHSLYYLFTQRPLQNIESSEVTKTYDRYIINNLDHSTDKVRINKYFILNPVPNYTKTVDILVGPKTLELIRDDLVDYTYTTELDCNPNYVIDLFQEIELLDYMSLGSIPIIHAKQQSMFVKAQITGYTCMTNPIDCIKNESKIVSNNIRKNLRYFAILKDHEVFKHFWKTHLELSCPMRTINYKNGYLLWCNFVYLYFMKRLEKIVGIEDRETRQNSQYKVVILDNRPNPMSIFSVLFTLANLNVMWACKIYTSKSAVDYYQKHLSDVADIVHYKDLDVNRFHIDIYNNVLKSSKFWSTIDSVKTLIIQDDGILLRPGIEKFMNYDYIGASWVDNVANEYIKTHISDDLVGNGGFSLRTTQKMIEVCNKYVKEKQWLFYKNVTEIPEDVYFVYGLKQDPSSTMPNHATGVEFASEEVCNLKSLGVHKVWSYHMAEITQKYLNGILFET